MNQSSEYEMATAASSTSTLTKDRFAWDILSHVILSALNVNNISSLQHWQGKDIAFQNHQFWLSIKSQGP